jgi:plastocyanin
MTSLRLLACVITLAACSSSDSASPDATTATSVRVVDCATSSPAMTVTTPGNRYEPATVTIPVGGVVRWTLPVQHDVSSTIPGLHIDFGGDVCLKFTEAKQYDYACSAHGFVGKVTAQ